MQLWGCSVILVFLYLVVLVLADTEIRNFQLPLTTTSASTESLLALLQVEAVSLSSSQGPIRLKVTAEEPERWISLVFEGDYRAWTSRLSWSASQPTRFQMDLYPHPDSKITRQAFLRISAKPLSPPMHHPLLLPLRHYLNPKARGSDQASTRKAHAPQDTDQVSSQETLEAPLETIFDLVLEPLLFEFLPRTAVPTVLAVFAILLGSGLAVPSIIRAIESFRVRIPEADDDRLKTE